MYHPAAGMYAFRLRRGADGRSATDQLEGVSYRYTAIVLIAAAEEAPEIQNAMLAGTNVDSLCQKLAGHLNATQDPGEVALTLWALRRWSHPAAKAAYSRLAAMQPATADLPTVELAWAVSALVVPGGDPTDQAMADRLFQRLLASQHPTSGLFSHWPVEAARRPLRGHVCCFADMVYPVLALSQYYATNGSSPARDAALRCGRRMCELQGTEGQWWWHFDIRTARVVERYPVYAVHQDGMAPMALFALQESCGGDYLEAINRGVDWLEHPAEPTASLVDRQSQIIWRKVCRREPNKLSRTLQAVASATHPALRVPGLPVLFPPRRIDWESRPYHMAWLLYAWSSQTAQRALAKPASRYASESRPDGPV